jgi:hypothetical protein
MILVYSSSLFWTVVFHACYQKQWLYAYAFSAVAFLSLNHHYYEQMHDLDKATAHFVFTIVLMHTITTLPKHINTLFYLLAIVCLWHAEEIFTWHATELHCALHIVAVLGMHAHLRRAAFKSE